MKGKDFSISDFKNSNSIHTPLLSIVGGFFFFSRHVCEIVCVHIEKLKELVNDYLNFSINRFYIQGSMLLCVHSYLNYLWLDWHICSYRP